MITFDQAVEKARDFVEEFPLSHQVTSERVLLHAVIDWMRARGATDADIDSFIHTKVDAQQATFWQGWEAYRETTLQRTA